MAMHMDSIGWKRLPSSFSIHGKEEGDSGMYPSNHFFPEEDEDDNQQLHQNQNNNNDGLLHASASSPMRQHNRCLLLIRVVRLAKLRHLLIVDHPIDNHHRVASIILIVIIQTFQRQNYNKLRRCPRTFLVNYI